MGKKFYITTPIYFPSAKLHIGHLYSTVACDAIARFKRMQGFDVMFLTGTDEHGQKIERIAFEANTSPKEYVDHIVGTIKDLWKLFDISNDRFIRTTDEKHEKAVQKIFQKLYEKGDIYKSTYEGWYCTPCESFWTEHQLTDGKCPDCGRPPELTEEESYFFRLSNYTDRLIELLESNSEFVLPQSRANEMLQNFLRPGLEDLAVSRTSFKWGIKVPFDEKHIIYVWVDALSNYITAMGYLSEDDSDFRKYWPADVHVMAKEIIRFHTIIWPAMLMALELPLPKQVFGHGWLILDGGKMSKSKGNVVDPVILCEKYGSDAIRYFLLREVAFGQDGVFSNEALINRINSDLANDLGNLVSRTVSMVIKYFGETLPPREEHRGESIDESLFELAAEVRDKMAAHMEKYNSPLALTEIWRFVSRTNKYIDETTPWILAKNEGNKGRLAAVLYNLCESIRTIAVMVTPFMPSTAKKIFEQIGVYGDELMTLESIESFGTEYRQVKVKKGDVLFPRIDLKKELEELESIQSKTQGM